MREPLGRLEEDGKRPSKAVLKKAVEKMRAYLGAVDFASVRDQGRLYKAVRTQVGKIATMMGNDEEDVWRQIEAQARKIGVVRATPGKNI